MLGPLGLNGAMRIFPIVSRTGSTLRMNITTMTPIAYLLVQDKKCRFENPIEPVEDCHPAGEIGMIWRQVSTALCLNDSDVESCDGLAKEKEHRDCYEPQ